MIATTARPGPAASAATPARIVLSPKPAPSAKAIAGAGAAEHVGEAVEDALERRPLRPRRAGVPGLREQDRQPRQVEHRGEPVGEQRVAHHRAPVGAGVPDGHQRRHRPDGEEQPPVVGVGEQRQRHREDGQPRAPALDEGDDEGRRHDHREQGDERVHPRLLRVVGQERVDRRQQRRRSRRRGRRRARARRSHAAGTVRIAKATERACVSASPLPKTLIHSLRIR